ncbi:MAG: SU10 major capsid protein [Phycisphaerales bacterium]
MDELLPNTDTINQGSFSPNGQDATSITVTNGPRFRIGDQVRPGNAREVFLVTAIAANVLTVTRRYGNSPASTLTNGQKLTILGAAALEGDDKPETRFTNRVRRRNYTQIFTAGVEVSGSMLASRQAGIADELDYQKQERLRELLRDLENCVIGGVAAAANPQGTSSSRRSMNGILPQIVTNNFTPGSGSIPAGGGGGTDLNEAVLNACLRSIWENARSRVDTIVVGGAQKRRINQFLSAIRQATPETDRFRDLVSLYESDFGLCRILLSRWVPADTVLFLDSSRLAVLPLAGRSFAFKPLAATGDKDHGQLIGEYTLEFRNELAHGALRGLSL